MERALRYFALAFFFSFPIVFAGLPAFWGGELPHGISLYEWVRILWLALGAAFLTAVSATALVFRLPVRFQKNGPCPTESPNLGESRLSALLSSLRFRWNFSSGALVLAGGFLIGSAFAHSTDAVSDVLAGRTYSWSVLLIIATVFAVFQTFDANLRNDSVRALLLGFVWFNLPYAVLQTLGFDPVSSLVTLPDWSGGRAFGTLGNPNSLAFFAAVCVPLAFRFFRWRRRLATVAALLAVILLSRSASGAAMSFGYLGYRYFGFWKTSAVGLIALVAFVFSIHSHPDKYFSIQTRTAIMGDVVLRSVSSKESFFLGNGAGSMEDWFAEHRSAEVTTFVSPETPIDRAHFLFLDLAFVFGFPFAVLLFVAAFLSVDKKTGRPAKEALSVFLILSCVHTPGLAHLVLAALLLAGGSSVPVPRFPRAYRPTFQCR